MAAPRKPETPHHAATHHETKAEPPPKAAAPRAEPKDEPPNDGTVPPQDPFFVDGKQVTVLMGPYRDMVLTMPIAEADQAIAEGWAKAYPAPLFDPNAPLPPPPTQAEAEASLAAAQLWARTAQGLNPVISSLSPATAVVGGADLTLTVAGSGFNSGSVILFNGGAEATTFVDSGSLTTIVKPSLASGAGSVPVAVRNGSATSNEKPFVFTAA